MPRLWEIVLWSVAIGIAVAIAENAKPHMALALAGIGLAGWCDWMRHRGTW